MECPVFTSPAAAVYNKSHLCAKSPHLGACAPLMPREMLDAGPEPPNFECQHLRPGPFRARPRFKRPLQTKSARVTCCAIQPELRSGQKSEMEVAPARRLR